MEKMDIYSQKERKSSKKKISSNMQSKKRR